MLASMSVVAIANEPPSTGQARSLVHNWEFLRFADEKGAPTFLITGSEFDSGDLRALRLDILDIPQGFGFFKTNVITARLYRADGEIVEPTTEGKKLLNSPVAISTASARGKGPNPQVMTFFPWGPNTLEECWIEVSIGPERYWLEIPYGFDRDPKDPLPSSIPGGRPKFVSAMKSLTAHDHVVRWKDVEYDLGQIQNGWQLSLIQSNPFDATSEVVLYRDDMQVGKSMYLWDLHTPHTKLRVVETGGNVIGGLCTDIHLHDDGMRRSDTFNLNRDPDDTRGWGQIEISVDDKTYRVTIPSSLYKYIHGHASVD